MEVDVAKGSDAVEGFVPSAEFQLAAGVEDQPELRKKYRTLFGIASLQTLVPLPFGIIMGTIYPDAETDASKVNEVQTLRCASDFCCHCGAAHANGNIDT